MNNKNYFLFSAIVFTFAALLHALRIVLGWELVLGGYNIPVWASAIAVIVTACLAYKGFKLSRGRTGGVEKPHPEY